MQTRKSTRQKVDARASAIDPRHAGLIDSYTFVVASDGCCTLHPRVTKLVGTFPWDWCTDEDKELCRESFIDACMFRKEVAFEARIHFEGRIVRLAFKLFPIDAGQVLCLFTRVFEGELSARERHVLALVAGGATSTQVAKALQISPSTARDHIAHIKQKLSIKYKEGFRLAAHYFGISGSQHRL